MGDSPAAVIVDATTGATATVLPPSTAPLATDKAVVVALSPNSEPIPTSNLSVGATGAAVPVDATQIAGPDGGGLLQAAQVLATPPVGTEKALVTRNIPSGVQAVSGSLVVTPSAANLDAGNSSTTPLLGNATFTGASIDVANYASVHVNWFTDADGTLHFQWSSNGSDWDNETTASIEAGFPGHLHTGPFARFFRVLLVNHAAPQTFLRLQTIENPEISAPHAQKIALPIQEDDDAILVKSALVGKTSSVQLPPIYKDILTDLSGSLQVGLRDSNGTPVYSSPFNELRVAVPYTLFDLVNKYEIDLNVLGVQHTGYGSAVFLPDQSGIKISVVGSGDYILVRTHTFFRYQAGRGMDAKFTLYNIDAGQPTEVRNWGFFDDNDGVFFRLNGMALETVVRSSTSGSPVETTRTQSAWDRDKCDGSGPSGLLLDITKANIYEVEFQWLGVGLVNFFINGFLVHQEQHANLLDTPYMRTATLPLSWEVIRT